MLLDLRAFFGVPLRQWPPAMMALTMALGVSAYTVTQGLLYNVIYPIIAAVSGIKLQQLRIELSHGGDEGSPFDTFEKSIQLGPVVAAVLTAAILYVMLINLTKAGTRWARQTQTECPSCLSWVPRQALKCAHCASDLPVDG
jgi:large-conductance mechanosensitive channel